MKSGYSRITTHIMVGFLLFLGIIAALVGVSVSYLSRMEASIIEIVRQHNVQLEIAQDMRYFVRHAAVVVRNVLLVDDPAQRQSELKRFSDAKSQYLQKRDELMANIYDDKVKAVFNSLKEDETVTLALWDKVVELSLSDKKKEATELLVTEVRSVQWKWIGGLDALVEAEKGHVRDADIYTANMYQRAKVVISLWGLLAVILGSAISVVITRGIAAPLEETIKNEVARRRDQEQALIHQSKLARMGQLLVNISHHWRQPLHTVGLIVQDLEEAYKHGELDMEYVHKSVAEAMEELRGMSNTINDFMNFYSPKEEKERFDLKVATAEVLTLLYPVLKDNLIDFTITCCEHNKTFTDIPEVIGCDSFVLDTYKQHFQYAMLNILGNSKDAILHRRKQGLLDKDTSGIIAVEFCNIQDAIKIIVSDNGGGIRENIMDKIFEPYFTTKEQGQGVGQGLYLSRIITERYLNGRIEARNIEGGAMFEVVLRHGRVPE
ncbi:integral membrane sensor signal transduction histidine kinase [Candidatus Magnetobacterium bavaricum]|uniref:histidine kinase n=1 Tax=Candidatus Magnetobacterium bavaricum TaxID=29290 RepID=A0A0F3GNL8_9BACT|nr:integral membrane sensor signal transduction histidine kinase [Candidatus Magnetobacterium bavaricum]